MIMREMKETSVWDEELDSWLRGRCTSSLGEGRMYIFPSNFSREDVHAPSTKGGCTSPPEGRMYILPWLREDVHAPPKERCTSSPREDVHPPLKYLKGGCTSSLHRGNMYIFPQGMGGGSPANPMMNYMIKEINFVKDHYWNVHQNIQSNGKGPCNTSKFSLV